MLNRTGPIKIMNSTNSTGINTTNNSISQQQHLGMGSSDNQRRPTKVKRQLNIQNMQGPALINFNNPMPNQIAWGNQRLKPRSSQAQTWDMKPGFMKQGEPRPGTAPKNERPLSPYSKVQQGYRPQKRASSKR